MDDQLAILVPVLGRPHRVAPLLASIEKATPNAHVLFIGDPHDEPERAAIGDYDGPLDIADYYPGGTYGEKINWGVQNTNHALLFLGADDLDFQPGWLEAATAHLTEGIGVVGVNDLLPRSRDHATHFLLTREYAELPCLDGDPGPMFWGYSHERVDDELIATAQYRSAYAYAEDAHVEHVHYLNGKAEMDATYEKGLARRKQDRRLFIRRSRLWK